MKYKNFIGIDVSKLSIDVFIHGTRQHKSFRMTRPAFKIWSLGLKKLSGLSVSKPSFASGIFPPVVGVPGADPVSLRHDLCPPDQTIFRHCKGKKWQGRCPKNLWLCVPLQGITYSNLATFKGHFEIEPKKTVKKWEGISGFSFFETRWFGFLCCPYWTNFEPSNYGFEAVGGILLIALIIPFLYPFFTMHFRITMF